MFKYDFIILYEHRKRELEDAVLLAMMLEKKGYKVAIEYRWSARILFQKTDVVIVPYLYFNETVIDFAIHPFCHVKKIINMQYEQVFPKKNEDILGDLPQGCAKNGVHISWGRNTTERYKKIAINPNNIFEVGHISIDLNMPKYRSVFLDRSTISKRFGLPTDRKWLLFISSFSCIGLTKSELKKWESRTVGTDYFSDLSYKSQPIILDFFEKLAEERPELIIIYRPHPHEAGCCRLNELEKKCNNFKVIADFSIRQWILVSDLISTWCSTSLADVYFAQKPCAIIRPIPFSEEHDYKIFKDQNIIVNYHDLKEFACNSGNQYKINAKSIGEYYCNDFTAKAFEKLRDVCIQVRNGKKYEYNYLKSINVSYLYLFMLYVYKILLSLAGFFDYSKFVPEKYRSDVLYSHREMRKCNEEIAFYRNRFSRIVQNEES